MPNVGGFKENAPHGKSSGTIGWCGLAGVAVAHSGTEDSGADCDLMNLGPGSRGFRVEDFYMLLKIVLWYYGE